MNQKQRMHAVLEGKSVDQIPVAVPYIQLYHQDHYDELSGQPAWKAWEWMYSEPKEHVRVLKKFLELVNFDIVQPQWTRNIAERANTQFIEIDGQPYRKDLVTGKLSSLKTKSGHLCDDVVNQTQFVYSIDDAREQITITSAEEILHSGVMDFAIESVNVLGSERFILTTGVLGVWYSCVEYLGLTNLFAIAAENPELVDFMCQLNLERNIEVIRCAASVGGDAIYIDDATMTSDMVSTRFYERFSLPYTRAMVDEIHRSNHKAILIYFGGVMDRLDLIAECGADGLIVETSMKGYHNNIGAIIDKIGQKTTLFGNIDPVSTLELGSDRELKVEVIRQIAAGKTGRGFVLSTGSPITPGTGLERVQQFVNFIYPNNGNLQILS
jgi:hypothetical protein